MRRLAVLATQEVSRCFVIDVAGSFPSDDDVVWESQENPAPRHQGHRRHRLLFRSNQMRMTAKNHEASPDGDASDGPVKNLAVLPHKTHRSFPRPLQRQWHPHRHQSFG